MFFIKTKDITCNCTCLECDVTLRVPRVWLIKVLSPERSEQPHGRPKPKVRSGGAVETNVRSEPKVRSRGVRGGW